MDDIYFDYKGRLDSLVGDSSFISSPLEERENAIRSFTDSYIAKATEAGIANDDTIASIRKSAHSANSFSKGIANAGRAPINEEVLNQAGFKTPDLNAAGTEEEALEAISEARKTNELADYDYLNADDYRFQVDQSLNSLERQVRGQDTGRVADLGYRALQGAVGGGMRMMGMTEQADAFETRFLPEKPEYDDRFMSKLAQGGGDFVASIGSFFVGTAIAGPIGGFSASFSGNAIRRYNDSYKQVFADTGNEYMANEAGLRAIPAAALESFADRIIGGRFLGKDGTKSLMQKLAGKTAKEKAGIIAHEVTDLSKRRAIVEGFLAEGISEASGDALASFGMVTATGNPDYNPKGKDLFDSFLIGGILGGAAGGVGQTITNQSEVNKNLKANQQNILDLMKNGNYQGVVDLFSKGPNLTIDENQNEQSRSTSEIQSGKDNESKSPESTEANVEKPESGQGSSQTNGDESGTGQETITVLNEYGRKLKTTPSNVEAFTELRRATEKRNEVAILRADGKTRSANNTEKGVELHEAALEEMLPNRTRVFQEIDSIETEETTDEQKSAFKVMMDGLALARTSQTGLELDSFYDRFSFSNMEDAESQVKEKLIEDQLSQDQLNIKPERYNPSVPEKIGEYTFDNNKGAGQVPNNLEVNYKGMVIYAKPSEFLNLNPDERLDSVDYIENNTDKTIGSPFVQVRWNEEKKAWQVTGHEGRNRAIALNKTQPDLPIPIHVIPDDYHRARNLEEDAEKRNAPFIQDSRKGNEAVSISGDRYVGGKLAKTDSILSQNDTGVVEVFHGGREIIEEIDPEKAFNSSDALSGAGFNTTNNKEEAAKYGPKISRFKIRLKNPFEHNGDLISPLTESERAELQESKEPATKAVTRELEGAVLEDWTGGQLMLKHKNRKDLRLFSEEEASAMGLKAGAIDTEVITADVIANPDKYTFGSALNNLKKGEGEVSNHAAYARKLQEIYKNRGHDGFIYNVPETDALHDAGSKHYVIFSQESIVKDGADSILSQDQESSKNIRGLATAQDKEGKTFLPNTNEDLQRSVRGLIKISRTNGNISTFIHEAMHVLRITGLINDVLNSDELQAFEDAAGVQRDENGNALWTPRDKDGNIDATAEELVARSFEGWLRTPGKGGFDNISPMLVRAFEKIRGYIKNIYKSLRHINKETGEEVLSPLPSKETKSGSIVPDIHPDFAKTFEKLFTINGAFDESSKPSLGLNRNMMSPNEQAALDKYITEKTGVQVGEQNQPNIKSQNEESNQENQEGIAIVGSADQGKDGNTQAAEGNPDHGISIGDLSSTASADIINQAGPNSGVAGAKALQDMGIISPLSDGNSITDFNMRPFVMVNFGNIRVPFYQSTGMSGKESVNARQWYPVFGISESGWINKGTEELINDHYGNPLFKKAARILDAVIGDVVDKIDNYSINGDEINQGIIEDTGITPVENTEENIKKLFDNIVLINQSIYDQHLASKQPNIKSDQATAADNTSQDASQSASVTPQSLSQGNEGGDTRGTTNLTDEQLNTGYDATESQQKSLNSILRIKSGAGKLSKVIKTEVDRNIVSLFKEINNFKAGLNQANEYARTYYEAAENFMRSRKANENPEFRDNSYGMINALVGIKDAAGKLWWDNKVEKLKPSGLDLSDYSFDSEEVGGTYHSAMAFINKMKGEQEALSDGSESEETAESPYVQLNIELQKDLKNQYESAIAGEDSPLPLLDERIAGVGSNLRKLQLEFVGSLLAIDFDSMGMDAESNKELFNHFLALDSLVTDGSWIGASIMIDRQVNDFFNQAEYDTDKFRDAFGKLSINMVNDLVKNLSATNTNLSRLSMVKKNINFLNSLGAEMEADFNEYGRHITNLKDNLRSTRLKWFPRNKRGVESMTNFDRLRIGLMSKIVQTHSDLDEAGKNREVTQNIKDLRKGFDSMKKEGGIARAQAIQNEILLDEVLPDGFDIDDAQSHSEIVQHFKDNYPQHFGWMEDMSSFFNQYHDAYKFTTEFIHSMPFRSVDYYLPTEVVPNESENHVVGVKEIDGATDSLIANAQSEAFYFEKLPRSNQMGTSKQRSGLREGYHYNLNAESTALRRGNLILLDTFTAHGRKLLSKKLADERLVKILGGEENGPTRAKFIKNEFLKVVDVQLREFDYMSDVERALNSAISRMARVNLSSVHQVFSQPMAAFSHHVWRNPRAVAYYPLAAQLDAKLHAAEKSGVYDDQMDAWATNIDGSLSLRHTQGDPLMEAGRAIGNESSPFANFSNTEFGRAFKEVDHKLGELAFLPIKWGDMKPTRIMLIAEVMQRMAEVSGKPITRIEQIDARSIPDTIINDANSMIDENVNVSRNSRRGKSLARPKTMLKLLTAFASHKLNVATNVSLRLRNLIEGTAQRDGKAVAESMSYIAAAMSQSLMFTAIKSAVLIPVSYGIAGIVLSEAGKSFLGLDDEDNEEIEIVKKEVDDFLQQKTSAHAVIQSAIRDLSGNLIWMGAFGGADNAFFASFVDPWAKKAFEDDRDQKVKSLELAKRNAAKLRDREAIAQLKSDIEILKNTKYIPMSFDSHTNFGLGGAVMSTVQPAEVFFRELGNSVVENKEFDITEWITLARTVGLGQSEINRTISLIEKAQNSIYEDRQREREKAEKEGKMPKEKKKEELKYDFGFKFN